MTIAILEGEEDDFASHSHSVKSEREVTLYMSFNDTSNEQGGIPDFDIQVEQLPRGQVKITVTEVQAPHWQEKRELEHHSSTSKTVLDVTLQHPCPAERVTDYMQKVDHDEFEAKRWKEERKKNDN